MAIENLQEKIEQGVVDIFCNPKVDSQASISDLSIEAHQELCSMVKEMLELQTHGNKTPGSLTVKSQNQIISEIKEFGKKNHNTTMSELYRVLTGVDNRPKTK